MLHATLENVSLSSSDPVALQLASSSMNWFKAIRHEILPQAKIMYLHNYTLCADL